MGAGQISGFGRVLGLEFRNYIINTSTRNFSNSSITSFMKLRTAIYYFWHLNANELPSAIVIQIELHDSLRCCRTACKEI